ncbi:type II toxin-antitoxin system YafQ family toxin [Candidatus Saccharibacteria bacterium]|nr:type II toxin-antitoxin system YafQ family toxin [Candidatus Saccharibacteria bacterium]
MKYSLQATSKFKKNYKQMQKRGLKKEELQIVVELLRNGKKLDIKYKDHALKGQFKKYRECHINPDWLLVYEIRDDILVLTLIDTGSHADLFNM